MRNVFSILFSLCFFIVNSQTLKFIDNDSFPVENVSIDLIDANLKSIYTSNYLGEIYLDKSIFQSNRTISFKTSHISFIESQHTIEKGDTIIFLNKKNIQLDQVFITAQITPKNQSNVVHKSKIIDRVDIDRQAATNLRELLDNQLNMSVNNDNVLGSSISMQGISGQNIKILIDGIPVIGRLNGNIDLSQINLNNIDRVEIIEGPLSVDFGTDALGGTINLITNKSQYDKSSSSINLYYETVGHYNSDINFSLKKNNNFFSFSGGRNYFDGWSQGDEFSFIPTAQLADTNRVKLWNPKEQFFAKIQFQKIFSNFKARAYYDFFDEKVTNLGFPRLPYYENAFDDYYYTRRNDLGLDVDYSPNKNNNFKLLSSFKKYNRKKNTYFKDLTSITQVLSSNISDQDTSDFSMIMNKLVYSSTRFKNLGFQIGLDSKFEQAKGVRIEGNSQTLGDHAIFTTAELKVNKFLSLRPALRASYNSKFNVPLIPSFNTLIKLNKIDLRMSYARGFRSPTLKELYFEFVDINHNILGNKDLGSENSNNFQMSIDFKKNIDKLNINFSSNIFFNDINNLITLSQSPNSIEYSYFNIGEYKTKGVSNSLKFSNQNFNFSIGNNYTGRYNNLSSTFDNQKYNFSHSLSSSFTYFLNNQKLSLSAFYKFTGKIPVFYSDNNQIFESSIDSYHLLDFIIKKSLINDKLKLKIGVKNLFNIQNISSFSDNSIHSSSSSTQSVSYGRTIFTSLTFNF
jgi:outer membrane receptor for ferrienterochelin and colicins